MTLFSTILLLQVQPEIKLKNSVQNHRPTESKVIPLGSRDVIPPSRPIYELLLTYNFSVSKATEITPQFPWMCDLLYESEFESQLWMLYNSHKQLVACGDAYAPRWAAKV
jgi:tripeptidyl-peptidase-2